MRAPLFHMPSIIFNLKYMVYAKIVMLPMGYCSTHKPQKFKFSSKRTLENPIL